MTSGPRTVQDGPATVRSPHLPDAVPKGARALWTSKRKGSSCGSDTAEAKDRPQGSETSIMDRCHGVQCKACGQSISTGIADPSLPIPWDRFTARIAAEISALNRTGSSLTPKMVAVNRSDLTSAWPVGSL